MNNNVFLSRSFFVSTALALLVSFNASFPANAGGKDILPGEEDEINYSTSVKSSNTSMYIDTTPSAGRDPFEGQPRVRDVAYGFVSQERLASVKQETIASEVTSSFRNTQPRRRDIGYLGPVKQ